MTCRQCGKQIVRVAQSQEKYGAPPTPSLSYYACPGAAATRP